MDSMDNVLAIMDTTDINMAKDTIAKINEIDKCIENLNKQHIEFDRKIRELCTSKSTLNEEFWNHIKEKYDINHNLVVYIDMKKWIIKKL